MAEAPVALVTGANKGIGYEIVRQLAARGASVWLAARDETRGRAAAEALAQAGGAVRFVALDVTDSDSVARASAEVAAHAGRLDVLVNNAGVQNDRSPPETADVDKIAATYETNVFGVIRVTQAFLPLLKTSPAGRIVMMSSELGSLTAQSDPRQHLLSRQPARLLLVQGRVERSGGDLRQGAPRHAGEGQRRRPRLHRHRPERPERPQNAGTGGGRRRRPRHPAAAGSDRRLLRPGRPAALVGGLQPALPQPARAYR